MREYPLRQLSSFVLLLVMAFAALASTSTVAQSAQSDPIVLPRHGICAHRGASASHPENTIAAFKEALRLGVHAVEFDVHWTKDRRLVLMHDATLARTTNVKALFPGRHNDPISSFTLAELKQLDAGGWKGSQFAGERIPTLEESLAMMPENIWLFIDIQYRPHLAVPVAREILRQRRRHQSLLLVTNLDAALAARQVDPKILVCSMQRPGYDSKNIADVVAHGYNALRFTGIGSPKNVLRLKKADVRILYCSDAKHQPSLKQLFDAGIDFPIVDDAAAVIRRVDPKAVVLAGSTANVPVDYAQAFLASEGEESFDHWSVHPYGEAPERQDASTRQVQELLRKAGKFPVLWQSKCGFSVQRRYGRLGVWRAVERDETCQVGSPAFAFRCGVGSPLVLCDRTVVQPLARP